MLHDGGLQAHCPATVAMEQNRAFWEDALTDEPPQVVRPLPAPRHWLCHLQDGRG